MSLAAFVVDKLTGTNLSTIHSGVTDNIVCFANADDDIRPANIGSYPIAVPQAPNYNYSYENVLRLRCITAPNNNVSNIKVYGPINQPGSGLVIGMGIYTGIATPTSASSIYATGTQHTQYYDNSSNYLSWTVSGSSTITGVNQVTNKLWVQLRVSPEASGNTGTMPLYTLTIEYDES